MIKKFNGLLLICSLLPNLGWAQITAGASADTVDPDVALESNIHDASGGFIFTETQLKNFRRAAGSASVTTESTFVVPQRANFLCPPKGVENEAVKNANPAPINESDCMEQRVQSARSIFEVEAFDFPTDYVSKIDSWTCRCAEQTLTGNVVKTEKGKQAKDEDEEVFQFLTANVKEKQQYIENLNAGMTYQSLLITKTPGGAVTLMGRYASPPDGSTRKFIDKSRQELIDLVRSKLKNPTPEKIKRLESIAALIKPPAEVESLPLPSATPPKNSCISMRAYLAYEQIPKEGEFYADLSKMGMRAKDEDWNMDQLKEQYDEAYRAWDSERNDKNRRAKLEEKVRSLRSRITFLRKNPMINNLFSAKDPEHLPLRPVLTMLKSRLLHIVKEGHRPGAKYDDYLTNLRKFFNQDTVQLFARGQLEENLKAEYENKEDLLSTKLPTTQKALENKFQLMTGQSVKECGKGIDNILSDPSDCTRKLMGGYCNLVDKVTGKVERGALTSLSRPSDVLEQESQFELNIDPNKNDGFKALSKEICEYTRVSRKDPNKMMNFDQFQKEHCEKKASKAECHPENSHLLVNLFIKEFKQLEMAGRSSEAVDAMELTFAGIMAGQPNKDLTASDIRKVKKASRSSRFFSKDSDLYSQTLAKSSQTLDKDLSSLTDALKPISSILPSDESSTVSAFAPTTSTSAMVSATVAQNLSEEVKQEAQEISEEREELEHELAESRRELARARDRKDDPAASEVEKRLKSLEELLAKKDAEYQELLKDSLNKKKVAHKTDKSVSETLADTENEEVSTAALRTPMAATTGGHTSGSEESSGRFPASLPEANSFSPGGGFASPVSSSAIAGGASVSGGGLFNAALLEKYGISVNGPTEGTILIAPDKDAQSLGRVADAHDGQSVPVTVTPSQYAKFKSNDLETLKEIYEENVRVLEGAVVKISVSTQGETPLEFYAIREGGKVVFQPVRKAKLGDLKLALPKS